MIKTTFYNLPDEKRQRIIDAVIDEFADTDSSKISINNVIKKANISRGSFYQYFDDKLDLVEVLIKYFVDIAMDDIRKTIAESDGDIFYTFEHFFDVVESLDSDERQRNALKSLVVNMRTNNTLISDYMLKRSKGVGSLMNMTDGFSRKSFRFKADEDMRYLQQILIAVFKNELYNYYVYDSDIEAVKVRYLRKLEIIKRGAYK